MDFQKANIDAAKKQTLQLDETSFDFIKKRTYAPISVYQNKGLFLRIGPKKLITKELNIHMQMLFQGFPVAQIIKEGIYENQYFYVEESLGDTHLGETFGQDYTKNKEISKYSFSAFKKISKKFATAQLSDQENKIKNKKEFLKGFRIDTIMEELPELKEEILKAFNKFKTRVSVFPIVLTHGDLNPHNLLPKGVIDLENTFYGPTGYDLISNIFTIYFFPKKGNYEIKRRYEFTNTQLSKYLNNMDKLYSSFQLPILSEYKDDYVFARSIYCAVGMNNLPKLQKWRYKLFRKILLQYIKGKSVTKTLLEFKL